MESKGKEQLLAMRLTLAAEAGNLKELSNLLALGAAVDAPGRPGWQGAPPLVICPCLDKANAEKRG